MLIQRRVAFPLTFEITPATLPPAVPAGEGFRPGRNERKKRRVFTFYVFGFFLFYYDLSVKMIFQQEELSLYFFFPVISFPSLRIFLFLSFPFFPLPFLSPLSFLLSFSFLPFPSFPVRRVRPSSAGVSSRTNRYTGRNGDGGNAVAV